MLRMSLLLSKGLFNSDGAYFRDNSKMKRFLGGLLISELLFSKVRLSENYGKTFRLWEDASWSKNIGNVIIIVH